MKYYELNYLISPHFSEEEQRTLNERISSYIQEKGRISLTHPIKKQMSLLLFTLDFYSDPEEIANIEKKLKTESLIKRYMILTKEIAKAEIKVPRRIASKTTAKTEKKPEEKKVELKEIEKKLEEILKE